MGSQILKTAIFSIFVVGLAAVSSCNGGSSSSGSSGGTGSGKPGASPTPTPTASPSVSVAPPGVYTRHYNNQRTGANPNETILTPSNVAPGLFGKIFTLATDGYTYAQPLYVPNVTVNGSVHNVLYVATAADSLFAFDADGKLTAPLWQVSFTDSSNGISALTPADTGCPELGPSIGISGTPVIDPIQGTIYLVANTKQTIGASVTYSHWLHAINIATGQDLPNSPIKISAPNVDPLRASQRPGLALNNGTLFIGFSSHCDTGPYTGTVLAYDQASLRLLSEYQDGDPGNMNGIWMSGMAPAIDSNGYVYVSTGNGVFDGTRNFGCSIVKLNDNHGTLSMADYFTPFDQATLNPLAYDLDLASVGTVVLPDQSGAHPHMMVAGGKGGQVYVLDRDNLGTYNASDSSFSRIIQSWNLNGTPYAQVEDLYFGTPAFFNNRLYIVPSGGPMKSYSLINGEFDLTHVDQTAFSFGFPGGAPTISANGTSNAIVWFVDSSRANNVSPSPLEAILMAYDANNLAAGPLYNSDQSGPHKTANLNDIAEPAVKHVSPTVFNGKVYVATKTAIDVYGLVPGGVKVADVPKAATTENQNSGARLSLNFDRKKSQCPLFRPSANYNFVIQSCGTPDSPCKTAGVINGTMTSGLDTIVSVPVGGGDGGNLSVALAPGTYQLLPAQNWIPNNGGVGADRATAKIASEVPYTFTVPQGGYVDFSANFICSLTSSVVVPGLSLTD